jgi:hypothetical protein
MHLILICLLTFTQWAFSVEVDKLNGVWNGDCYNTVMNSGKINNNISMQTSFTFNNSKTVVLKISTFKGLDCLVLTKENRYTLKCDKNKKLCLDSKVETSRDGITYTSNKDVKSAKETKKQQTHLLVEKVKDLNQLKITTTELSSKNKMSAIYKRLSN